MLSCDIYWSSILKLCNFLLQVTFFFFFSFWRVKKKEVWYCLFGNVYQNVFTNVGFIILQYSSGLIVSISTQPATSMNNFWIHILFSCSNIVNYQISLRMFMNTMAHYSKQGSNRGGWPRVWSRNKRDFSKKWSLNKFRKIAYIE